MTERKSRFVIYWEKGSGERGFVSYDNKMGEVVEQYKPVSFGDATRYLDRKKAEQTANWYRSRGGFGEFRIMEVKT